MAAKDPGFHPVFTITPAIARGLMRNEAVKHAIEALPITPRVLANVRETARLSSTHCSTMIERNLLTQEQVAQVIAEEQHFPCRERDQQEVRGYYAALDEVERLAGSKAGLTEKSVQSLHALGMGTEHYTSFFGVLVDRLQWDWFDVVLKEAALSGYTWHVNRHTFASRLVMAGVDLRTVAELLEHRTFQMTMRYAHLAPAHTANAVEVLCASKSVKPTDTSLRKSGQKL